ncbi:hypothetical protein [Vibrio genomosp. F10]|uniref:hypothetical protein n=1 Tax=Vibrio genomosp. F10 TaxID=723171 RepID=UPI003CEBA510
MQGDVDALLAQLKVECPEILEVYLPQGTRQKGMAIISVKKEKAGQGPLLIEQALAVLNKKMAIKFVVVCDGDVNVTDWNDIIWAITTRMDPSRDSLTVTAENADGTKISAIGLDATNKNQEEVRREWGVPIQKDPQLVGKIDKIWDELAIL